MELRQLRYFMAVADTLSFRQAASRLQMTQPPLSQQIRLLEHELGVALFDRSTHHVRLTDVGHVFHEQVRSVLDRLDVAVQSVHDEALGRTGTIQVGFVGSATYDVLPRVMRHTRAALPGLNVHLQQLTSGEQITALLESRLDVGFLRPPVDNHSICVHSIMENPYVAAIPTQHPLAEKQTVEVTDLRTVAFVLLSRTTWPAFFDGIIAICQNHGQFSPHIVQEAPEFQPILGLVAAGLGISIVPADAQNWNSQHVVYRPLGGPWPLAAMILAWHHTNTRPAVLQFLNLARSSKAL